MNWFTALFSSGANKVIDSVSNGLDKLFTSDAERLDFKNKLQAEMNTLQLSLQDKINEREQEITKRWQSDNEHIITRLVRPLSFIYMLALFSLIVLLDGNFRQFHVNPQYIPMIGGFITTMVIAYFGSRGIEKSIKIIKRSKDVKTD